MTAQKNQGHLLTQDAVRVIVHAKFTKAHDRGPMLDFNGEINPARALRFARECLAQSGLNEHDVVWDGVLLSSLLKNGINHIDVVVTHLSQKPLAGAFIKEHGQATAKVCAPDIRIVVSSTHPIPGQVKNHRTQVPFNCDSAY